MLTVSNNVSPTDARRTTSDEARSPVVSVLMTVYNGEKYIVEAVDSILNQTYTDLEFIVIDDGSTDNTANILRDLAANDPRLKVYTEKNRGIARSMNHALRLAKGEFVAKMDADDVSLPKRLEVQVKYLREHPEVVGLGSAWEVIDDAGRLLTALHPPTDDQNVQAELLKGHGAITHACGLMRREELIAAGSYDETFDVAEDLDMWLRLGERGKLENLPQVLVQYRIHNSSVSEQRCRDQREYARRACELAWKRRGISGTFEAEHLWRAGTNDGAKYEFLLRHGWWAFNSAQRSTALLYGVKAISVRPLRPDGWRLFVCAAIKKMHRQPAVRQ